MEPQLSRGSDAGCDETGTGAWAGPMIAAAVVITPGVYIDNLADSKTLLPKERAAAYQSLVSHPQVFMATCAPFSVYPGRYFKLRCRIFTGCWWFWVSECPHDW